MIRPNKMSCFVLRTARIFSWFLPTSRVRLIRPTKQRLGVRRLPDGEGNKTTFYRLKLYIVKTFFFYILMGSYSSAVIHRRKVLYLLLVVDDYSRYTSGFLYLERSPKLFLREIYRKFWKSVKSPDQEVEVWTLAENTCQGSLIPCSWR